MYEDCALVAINKAIINAAKQDIKNHIAEFDYEISDYQAIVIADFESHHYSDLRFSDIYNYLDGAKEYGARKRLVTRIRKKYAEEIEQYKREQIIGKNFSWTRFLIDGLNYEQKRRYERRTCRNIDELNAAEWFRNNAASLVDCWIKECHGGDLAPYCRKIQERSICGSEELVNKATINFTRYFARKREEFMKKTEDVLAQRENELAKIGKHPQSHGGVANLLKVLTNTMHEQGNSIYTIAKVQYQICMQAGIYIPDEFLTDILVAGEMLQED